MKDSKLSGITFTKTGNYFGGKLREGSITPHIKVYCEIQTTNNDGSIKSWGEVIGVEAVLDHDMVYEVMAVINLRNYKCTSTNDMQVLKSASLDPKGNSYLYRVD